MFRCDNSLRFSTTNQAEFGIQVTNNQVTYDYDMEEIQREEEEDDSVAAPRRFLGILNWDSSGTQYSAYLQDRWTIFGRFTLTPGIRFNRGIYD